MTEPFPTIPADLLPRDGRFGSGPSKIRPQAWDQVTALSRDVLGTSHRRAGVKDLTRRLRTGIAELYNLPTGYEVLFDVGGCTSFWDSATYGLIERRSSHMVCGEFSARFADIVDATPFLDAERTVADVGCATTLDATAGVDAYCQVHNETSTAVTASLGRVLGADDGALMLVDATSAAGALPVDVAQTDAYYFSLQKGFASDGGMWVAIVSPAAVARIGRLSGERFVPRTLDLARSVEHSRQDQTLNTPGVVTVALAVSQVEWLLGNGGLSWAHDRCVASATVLYEWAQASDVASCFVKDPAQRSVVNATIDLVDEVDAEWVVAALRANGVVDVDPYRKLGRNQLRVGLFPSVETSDVESLTSCVDWLMKHGA